MKPPQPSPLPCLFLALLAGVGVRLAWIPTWSRLTFDGHERLYVDAFQGNPPDPSSQAWPLLCWLYQGLGILTQDPRALTVVSVLAGAAAVAGAALWAHRNIAPMAGIWTALFVALLPEHAAWSTSPYHVILPHAFFIWGFVLPRWWATACMAIACSMRPELCLLAPFAGLPGLGGIAGLLWYLGIGSPTPDGSLWLAFQSNWHFLGYLGPAILALALGGIKDRRCWKLFVVVAVVHFSGSLFADYGSRHALFGSVVLCIVCAAVVERWTPVLGLICLLILGQETQQMSRIWHSKPDLPNDGQELVVFQTQTDANGTAQPILPEDCIEISEEPPISGQPIPSHLYYFAGEIETDCVLWGMEFWHGQWSSRGLRDRARRMSHLYTLSPVAYWQTGSRPPRLYYRVQK